MRPHRQVVIDVCQNLDTLNRQYRANGDVYSQLVPKTNVIVALILSPNTNPNSNLNPK